MTIQVAGKSEQKKAVEGSQTGTVTGQLIHTAARPAKTHREYWHARVRKRTYINASGVKVQIPEFYVRLWHQGHEEWFPLHSANHNIAACRAQELWEMLKTSGIDAVRAKYKPSKLEKAEVCTVGEFITAVTKHSHLKPKTARTYTGSLRELVGDIVGAEKGLTKKQKRRKYDYHSGGRREWLATIDPSRLDVLSPESVREWRAKRIAKAKADPSKRKSAERTAASILRNVKSMFRPEVTELLKLKLPPSPFAGVKVSAPGPQRYHSTINPALLLKIADRELAPKRFDEYLALSLALWAGLRRQEADLLLWENVDLSGDQIHVRTTQYHTPKTEEGQRSIDIGPELVAVLKRAKKGCTSEFVLPGKEPRTDVTYGYYRAAKTFKALNIWLKSKGVKESKAVHSLRKESGSLVSMNFGIEAARAHLGHRDITTTSAHYVEKRRRVQVSLQHSGTVAALTG